jgi:hypothetical protein
MPLIFAIKVRKNFYSVYVYGVSMVCCYGAAFGKTTISRLFSLFSAFLPGLDDHSSDHRCFLPKAINWAV